MKKIKLPSKRILTPIVIFILLVAMAVFILLTISYYKKSFAASEKINKFIIDVALEGVDIKKAEEVILNLEADKDIKIDVNKIVSPFKSFKEGQIETAP